MTLFKFSYTAALASTLLLLGACGGGGSGSSSEPVLISPAPTPAPTPTPLPVQSFSIGGSVTGLGNAGGLTLANGSETLPVSANATSFTFVNKTAQGNTYSVTIAQQPSGRQCTVSNATGTVQGGDVQSIVVNCTPTVGPTAFLVTTFAGDDGQTLVDGVGTSARVGALQGLARDSAGNVYFGDAYGTAIRKLSTQGVVTTLAGGNGMSGYADGVGASARFASTEKTYPYPYTQSLAFDGSGNVYVADGGNHAIRKITPSGTVSTLAGNGTAGFADGMGTAAQFNAPGGVAVDSAGNVYVADESNHAIRKITPSGAVSTLAGNGSSGLVDGLGAAARFSRPHALMVDAAGNLYVAEWGNHAIRKVTPSGAVTTVVSQPNAGTFSSNAGQLCQPSTIVPDGTGNLYMLDICLREVLKLTSDGTVKTVANLSAQRGFMAPKGLAIDNAGNLLIADMTHRTIRMLSPDGVVTPIIGQGPASGRTDGVGTAARFQGPSDIATDGAGNVYVADSLNALIRKITPSGVVTTLAGGGNVISADATGAAAGFRWPISIASDNAGNVYVSDVLDKAVTTSAIRKITPDGVVTTLRQTSRPSGMAADSAGTLYMTVQNTVVKLSASGVLTTLAGGASPGADDGAGSTARFNGPSGIALDAAGNAYVADTGNNAIRKISPQGQVTTLASGGFGTPDGIAIDAAGNVYATASLSIDGAILSAVRKVSSSGVVATVAGGSAIGYADGVGASARFNWLSGIAMDSTGNIYVGDYHNNAIRKIVP